MQSVAILGSTGSIGISTLDVLARHPDRFAVFALTANHKYETLAQQCIRYQPKFAVLRTASMAGQLRDLLSAAGSETQVLVGEEGLVEVASHHEVDTVVAAIVGAAGLLPTLAAVKSAKKVLLANKEALVMAGGLFMSAVAASGATLLPIDSEHNAIFQCMPTASISASSASSASALNPDLVGKGVRKILLTGSGGPLRVIPMAALAAVTPDEACAHPNWSMGRKISVDSATMMNKGLEFIEACWLFNVRPEQIQVVIHPQSIIHSMVEYVDGSVLAQMGNPDMRTPIAHALAWPQRVDAGVDSLDIIATARLDFQAPDMERFPCLQLAIDAATAGGVAPAILNAANEVAVDAFLQQRIGFVQIVDVIKSVCEQMGVINPQSVLPEPKELAVVQKADCDARIRAAQLIDTLST